VASWAVLLALAVASETPFGPLRKPYGTAAGVLRLRGYKRTGLLAVPADPLYLAAHPERAGVEVYVRPLKPESLTLPEPGREAEDVLQRLVTVPFRGAEKLPRLLGVEGLYLLLADPRLVGVGGGVTEDEVSSHGLFERGVQDGVYPALASAAALALVVSGLAVLRLVLRRSSS